jgi:hypothetical protein
MRWLTWTPGWRAPATTAPSSTVAMASSTAPSAAKRSAAVSKRSRSARLAANDGVRTEDTLPYSASALGA